MQRLKKSILFIGLAASSYNAWAVYRCETADKAVSYQAAPCPLTVSQATIPVTDDKRSVKELATENAAWKKCYKQQLKAKQSEQRKRDLLKARSRAQEQRQRTKKREKCRKLNLKIRIVQKKLARHPLNKKNLQLEDSLMSLETEQEEYCAKAGED